MPNPRYLFCDSDALFQTFLTKQSQLLRLLRRDYGIAPVIVPEVELELFSTRKFKHLSASVTKALRNGVLVVFDAGTMSDYLGGNPNAAGPTYDAIQISGTDYARRVGRGEAYTFATASYLNMPALSNDRRAVGTLLNVNFQLPSPVLRFFDLVAFGHHTGTLSESDCNTIRRTLLDAREGVPTEFKNTSFGSGITKFNCRLSDKALNTVTKSKATASFEACLVVERSCSERS